ncbi:MAG: lamin tail domain-containing protein [Patescibacteria group bacterium]
MKNIIIAVLIFSGIVIFASYSGIVKINAPENLFGKADKISSDGFQFVGKVNLLENQQAPNLKNNSIKQFSSDKITNITSIIAPVASVAPIAPTASTSTSTAPIEPIAVIPVKSAAPESSVPIASVAPVAPQAPLNIINIGISEILVGIDGNIYYEFIELYNPNDAIIDLTGYSIKKRSSTGDESLTLIASSRFKDKKIASKKYFLLAKEEGYNGQISPDIFWPKSSTYALAYKNNAIILYNANGETIEDIGWDEIIKGQSLERISTPWSSGEFKIQNNPNPQNSQSN